jgi:lipoprotein-anchoring transpeptidase ErfK/SrfK
VDTPENMAMARLFRLIAAIQILVRSRFDAAGKEDEMSARGLLVALFGVGVLLGGCMQSTIEPASEANLTARDKKLLAAAPYEKAAIPEPYKRHIVEYHRKEAPGTILIDSDARYLYYVLPEGKAIRYGVTVGEEALAWSGVAKVGRMTEWPTWTPTAEIKKRMDVPDFVGSGPQNPMGARAMYLFEGNKDTLYRIHGTNQPEYIGQAISSGCIRMTNEDVIDLYKRVKTGTVVVVLAPHQGDTPFNPRLASSGGLFDSDRPQRIKKRRPRAPFLF